MGRTDKLAVAAASRRGDRGAPEVGGSDVARELEALRNRVLELEELFDDASTGLVRTTRAGRVLQANRALLEILECRKESCVGHDWASFHSDRGSVGDLIERLTRRETLRNHPAALRARGGRLKEVLVDASALWQRGRIVHIRWFVRDITRRKQLEREVLATSERERRSFARELHDSLGQQLSGIAYLGGVLHARLRELELPEAGDAQRIVRLIRVALEETRRVSRKLSPVHPEPEGLDMALRELVAQTRTIFGVDCRLRRPKPVLVSDGEGATHLYRIAQEAVSNAIRHGRARRISIGLRQWRDRITLRISDNGKGIGVLSPRRKGMGLRVMQYRASLLQGRLSVERRAEGGTVVCCVAALSRRHGGEPAGHH